jgi:hypothetical protein
MNAAGMQIPGTLPNSLILPALTAGAFGRDKHAQYGIVFRAGHGPLTLLRPVERNLLHVGFVGHHHIQLRQDGNELSTGAHAREGTHERTG